MSLIDFLLQYLALVLASVTSALVLATLGYFGIKRVVRRAMESEEVQGLQKALESLKTELEKLKEQFDKLFEAQGRGEYVA